ncbi:polysaccharide deacetylase family protein [Tardiphaga sp. 1201_B9_N1_1]|jgi:allantoinase|uniref:polysaccharide deacetylase family protein n=1 Tax=Tardiphaga TaxID=1395974 RepID=UPI000E708A67|nr:MULTISPECIES: polysaccharide deacetylase family protein [Tardiphaga]MDR6661601.1 peptidoglycan/xylan/chitin deacetylase (PgdA/CDA1 family) [Tardiphaga robiniae]UFS73774.1 polysaccharide deacetylase family protein [Tardiphaga sp. 37S4]
MIPCKPNVLDQDIYPHSPLPGRKPWKPHGAARIAFVIYLYFEQFEAMPPQEAIFDRRYIQGFARHAPHLRANAAFEYGNRVGIFRVLDLLDRHGLRASVAANNAAVTAYPYLVDQFLQRGFEFLAHGDYASRMITSAMPLAQQRQIVARSQDTLERATGQRPKGWLSQDYGQSRELPSILAETGFDYLCDYGNDEQPYATTTTPPLISVPNQSEWNDVEMLVHRKVTSEDYALSVMDAFDGLYAEGAASTKFFGLHIHPWISAQPARFRHLSEIVEHIASHTEIWHATTGEIVSRVK